MNNDKLVDETFNNKFDLEQYKKFLSNLFNTAIYKEKPELYGKEHSNYVNKVINLGKFKDVNNTTLCFFVVELTKESSLYRARTMQRNLIAKLLKNNFVDHALVAFYDTTNPDWRFSYVNREYTLTEKGIKEKLSPAKRHSFLVGPNEPNHTCKKQFSTKIIQDNVTVEEIKESFDIETVTKEFFEKYRKLFIKLDKSLKQLVNKDENIKTEFENKNISTEDFAKKIMGQIVFLYFIQKKGWLGVDKEKEWGSGPKDFMRKLYEEKYIPYDNFFNDVLEPLFYQGLSEDVTDYHYEQFNCKIPFLNGGLFENINGYDWKKTDILIDNDIFEEILDTFDTFNFTIKEDEPLDKEVAVDPEMLGKVFENLLTSIERKKNGTFYTPRNIVHFMCQQTLIEYLKTNTSINEEEIREFIEEGYLHIDSIIKNHNEKIKYNGQTYTQINLPQSILDNAKQLDELLKNVKVVDPAVGSGAFPVGMMYEIVNSRYLLNILLDNTVDLYILKKETIENSLYGVDLSYSATDITKLRFWLSLIVDEEKIEPLPNLDNKILAGDSLLDTFHDIKIYDKNKIENNQTGQLSLFESYDSRNKFKQMESYKHDYFNEKSPNRKKELKKQINDMKWKFIESSINDNLASDEKSLLKELEPIKNMNSKPFFVWELEFSEIFQTENPGFDIVIGNPPYVKETKSNGDLFILYKNNPYYKSKMDLWYFFGSIGLDLLKENGCISYIAPNNWTTTDGGSIFREKILKDAEIKMFIDFGDYKVFESANQQTMIYLMNKNNSKEKLVIKCSLITDENISNNDLDTFLYSKKEYGNYYKKYLSEFNRLENHDKYFKFNDKKEIEIINKILDNNVLFIDNKEVFTGVDVHQDFLNQDNAEILGRNDIGAGIFVISNNEKNKINFNEEELKIIKPYYTSKELNRYQITDENKYWLIYTKSNINNYISKYPNIKNHLDQFEKIITSDNKPYGLHRARKEEIFLGKKIISLRKTATPKFTLVDFPCFVSQSFNVIKTKDIDLPTLTGILNSNLIKFWLKVKGKMQGSNFQVDQKPIREIPIITNKDNVIKENVEMLYELNRENNDDNLESKNIENKINKRVYELYGLTDEEMDFVENNI